MPPGTARRACLVLLAALALGFSAPAPAHADFETAKKAFLEGARNADWKERRAAYGALRDYDGGPGANLVLSALSTEAHLAVQAAGVETLSGMRSPEARGAMLAAFQKGKAVERLLASVALSSQKGADVDAALLEALGAGPAPLAAQAALALGQVGRASASGPLVKALGHEAPQVRIAAARALGSLADKAATQPLVDRLKVEKGRARAEVIAALEAITGQRLGDVPARWAAVASGGDPAKVEETPAHPPTFFGAPVTGERVAFVIDRSLNMRDAHPLVGPEQRERLEALCTPADGERIPWRSLKTKLQLTLAQLRHAVDGLPSGGRFEVLTFAADVQGVFGRKWSPVTGATRKTANEALASLAVDDGINLYDALSTALDLGGPGEDKAWKAGPDQILLVTNNVPTAGEVKEADVITSAIALRARLRMVSITTVGIGNHPFSLAEGLAKRTGGVYVNLTK